MRRVDRRPSMVWLGLLAALLAAAVAAAPADEAPLRHRADIVVTQRAPFVVLPLDVAAYARSEASLADLRVVDAKGERVPFAVLPPAAPAPAEFARELPAYPLPARKAGQPWLPASVQLRVEPGGALTLVQRRAAGDAPPAAAPATGWLFDLGDDAAQRADARRIELRWSADADFTAGYRLETSADLQRWQPADGGQLLQLGGSGGALRQPRVALPAAPPRFVRLAWDDPASAPRLDGAQLLRAPPTPPASDQPVRIEAKPRTDAVAADTLDGRALLFDLGAVLPLARLDLALGAGTRIAPVTVQARAREADPWRDIGRHAFWQLERDGRVARSEPLALHGQSARHLRIVGDARAARLDPATTRLVAHAPLARLVVATQGQPPWALLAGHPKVAVGALPVHTLVPDLVAERARFGAAELGAWSEIAEVAAQAKADARRAALRPWLLWAVLGVGVAALATMAWRLSRKTTA